MTPMPAEIWTVDAVREIDRRAIKDEGIPGYTLMSRAGAAAVACAMQRFPRARRWQVVCGAGNNAGDGYVVARLAAEAGIVVSAVAVSDPESLSGDAAIAWGDFAAGGGVVTEWDGSLDDEASLIVDALLGSGLSRDVEGAYADAVRAINTHRAPTLALDIPSGVHGDTGAVLGAAVEANATISFVGLKAGLFLGDGLAHRGALEFADLEVPPSCREGLVPVMRRIGDDVLANALPRRPRAAHKGDFGHVLVVGGGPGMPGAIRLAGEAALRAGAGRVSLATHPDHAAAIVAGCPELMAHGIETPKDLDALLDAADVVAFGPGLGRSAWADGIYKRISDCEKAAVWDADALNLLATAGGKNEQRVLTPHPGEAGRLLKSSTAAVQRDRLAAVAALRDAFGGVAVLKGAGTLIAADEGPPWLCAAGNPGMASPGMGDVLTGIIAAFVAQGLSLEDAATCGALAHARAGDRAAGGGERGLLARDLLAELRAVVNPRDAAS